MMGADLSHSTKAPRAQDKEIVMLPFVPFGSMIDRFGDLLVSKLTSEVFGENGNARSTRVIIFNRTNFPLFLVGSGFESGGFTTNASAPFQIDPKSVAGYQVESHGFMTGVTGATMSYGFEPGNQQRVDLQVVTSNPFAGGNSWNAMGFNGVITQITGSVGNNNQVEVDVRL